MAVVRLKRLWYRGVRHRVVLGYLILAIGTSAGFYTAHSAQSTVEKQQTRLTKADAKLAEQQIRLTKADARLSEQQNALIESRKHNIKIANQINADQCARLDVLSDAVVHFHNFFIAPVKESIENGTAKNPELSQRFLTLIERDLKKLRDNPCPPIRGVQP